MNNVTAEENILNIRFSFLYCGVLKLKQNLKPDTSVIFVVILEPAVQKQSKAA